VLSTNYDRMFVQAANARPAGRRVPQSELMAVLGGSQSDCQTPLASLSVPMSPVYWALQGYLGFGLTGANLRSEIVLGYEQYREATFNNPSFRAAFSEVFRNRSLLHDAWRRA
jgi:SIR2-like domain